MSTLFTNINNTIDVHSTSLTTANTTPIVLNETEMIKTSFEPMLIDNEKDRSACVSGKFVHQRKSKKDESFPSEKISKKSVKTGDILELRLSSSETKKLFDGLTQLYQLHSNIGFVPPGDNTYAKIDSSLLQTIRQLEEINDNVESGDIIECINILFKILAKRGNLQDLSEQLGHVEGANNLMGLCEVVNIAKLKSYQAFFENNIENDNEEDWQSFLTSNQWLISQLFSYPATIYKDKAYVGGKTIFNSNGKVVDYLYRNDLTKNVALIEIKTPKTKLLGSAYRNNIYSVSDELSGGVNQILRYKDTLLKNWQELSMNQDIIAFNPDSILIIGNTSEFGNNDQKASFELWRSSLNGIVVLTFDEFKQKIDNLINALCAE